MAAATIRFILVSFAVVRIALCKTLLSVLLTMTLVTQLTSGYALSSPYSLASHSPANKHKLHKSLASVSLTLCILSNDHWALQDLEKGLVTLEGGKALRASKKDLLGRRWSARMYECQ